MKNNQEVPDHLLVIENTVERRGKPRIYDPFPATVHGVDASGAAFRSRTIIDNISTGGLYLRLMQRLEPSAKLYVVIQLSNVPAEGDPWMRLHVSGEVLRAEPMLGGACGLAVSIRHNRFT